MKLARDCAAWLLTYEDHQVVIWQVAGPVAQRTHLRDNAAAQHASALQAVVKLPTAARVCFQLAWLYAQYTGSRHAAEWLNIGTTKTHADAALFLVSGCWTAWWQTLQV
jgi:hypothetical protein